MNGSYTKRAIMHYSILNVGVVSIASYTYVLHMHCATFCRYERSLTIR